MATFGKYNLLHICICFLAYYLYQEHRDLDLLWYPQLLESVWQIVGAQRIFVEHTSGAMNEKRGRDGDIKGKDGERQIDLARHGQRLAEGQLMSTGLKAEDSGGLWLGLPWGDGSRTDSGL